MRWFNNLSRIGKLITLVGGLVILYLCFFGVVAIVSVVTKPTPTVVAGSPAASAPLPAASVPTALSPTPSTASRTPTSVPPGRTPSPSKHTPAAPTHTAAPVMLTPEPTSTPTPTATAAFVRPASSTLEGTISENTVLDVAGSPYTVKGALTVNQGVALLVQPGVIVKFVDDAHLRVYGTLQARGRPNQRVVFTSIKDDSYGGDTNQDGGSSAPDAGDWTYIGFFDSSNDANSVIDYALIRYAGEHRGSRYGAIHIEAASPTVTNSSISDSFWYAISADVHSFPIVKGNTLANNQGNGLEIRAGTMSASGTWANVDVVYAMTGIVNVAETSTLTIQPGITVKFADGVYIDVFGALKAQGTAEQQIVFTSIKDDASGGDTNGDGDSSVPAAGDWTMVRFRDQSNDANSIVSHSLIRCAGKQRVGAIHLEAASPSLVNNVFTDNYGYAISADVNSFPTVRANNLTDNSGNGLEIRAGSMSASGTWNNTDIVYSITGVTTVPEGTTLAIAPNVTVKFSDNTYIDVYGALRAQGTDEQHINFTSIKDDAAGGDTNGDEASSAPSPGDWTMIRFRDTSNDANSLVEYAVIQYAGKQGGNRFGAIHLESASPTIANNMFIDNFGYAISADPHSFPSVGSSQVSKNSGNGLEIRGGDMRVSGTWQNVDVVYAVTGPVVIHEGATLSLKPGVTVKFVDNAYFDVFGTFRAEGSDEKKIALTSIKDDAVGGDTNGDADASAPSAGDWTMIRFRDASNDASSIVKNAIIRYAGENAGSRFGAIHLEAASPTIANNIITDNFWYAISADVHAFPSVSGNRLSRNVGNGLEVRSGEMRSSGTWESTDIAYSVPAPITVKEGATLTLKPGVIVKFGDNGYFDVFGAFRAIGATDQRITFTSIKDDTVGGDTNGDEEASAPAAGDWTMLRFRDTSNDASSMVKHAVIRYAGEHGGNRYGAIHLEAASPTIANNVITHNFWYAISADVNSFPIVSDNKLLQNVGNGLDVRAGEMVTGGTWANTDIVYVVMGPVEVRNTATLTIAPGVTAKFTENAHINVHGAFRSLGSAEQKVVLTSLKDDTYKGDTNGDGGSSTAAPGDWTMVRFYDDSNDASCIIDHTVIRYAGRWRGDRYGAIHILSASPTVRNSTISDSFFYGIWYDANSSPKLSGNTFSGNAEGSVFQQK